MARAPALQAGGRRFDSDYLHKRFDHLIGPFFVFRTLTSLTTPLSNIPLRVTEVYILSLATLTLIRIPPFFTCMKVPMSAYHPYLLWPLLRILLAFILSKVTDVFILSLSPLNLIRIPLFFICMNVSMSAYHPCLLWPLFRIPSEFIPSKFTERCVYLRKCYTF